MTPTKNTFYAAMLALCSLAENHGLTVDEIKEQVVDNKERSKSTVKKIKRQHHEKARVKLKDNKIKANFVKNTSSHGRLR